MNQKFLAKGSLPRRFVSILFLLPAWFAPHKILRVFFHRLRGVTIGKNVEIGYFCIIGNVHPNLITIENNAVIAAGAVLLEHDNSYYYTRGGDVKIGRITIRKNAFIGVKAVVLPGITIGKRAIVGPNSVVVKDVRDDSVVSGIPACEIKRIETGEDFVH